MLVVDVLEVGLGRMSRMRWVHPLKVLADDQRQRSTCSLWQRCLSAFTSLTMRLQIQSLALVLLGWLNIVSALSATSSKLLVVIDEDADKAKYSHFWSDLTGELLPRPLHHLPY